MPRERVALPLELPRLPDVVGRAERHVVALRLPEARVERARAAAVLLADQADAIAVAAHDVDGPVGRAVVHDDHLERRERLGEDRVERLGDEALLVVGGDDDADRRPLRGGHPRQVRDGHREERRPRGRVRTLRPLKVGLNLLHLVPGETGGSEIYARRLVPALLEARRSRARPLRLREGAPALRAEPWAGRPRGARSCRCRAPAGPAGPGRADARCRAPPAAPASTCSTTCSDGARRARRAPGDHHPRSDLPALPRGALRLRSLGMRVLVPLAARRSTRIIAISEATKCDVVSILGVDPSRVDVIYLAPGFTAGPSRLRGGDPRPALARRGPDRPQRLRPPAAQEPRAADRRRRSPRAAGRPRRPGLRDALGGRARRARPPARGGEASAPARLDRRRGARGPLRICGLPRLPLAGGGLRPAGAGGDGPRPAGCLLERDLAARGGGRGRALLRPARTCRR